MVAEAPFWVHNRDQIIFGDKLRPYLYLLHDAMCNSVAENEDGMNARAKRLYVLSELCSNYIY